MSAAAEERAADFVRRFADFWAAPSPQLLGTLLADPVRLQAPLTPMTETLAEAERTFAGLLELIPDLTAGVNEWGATGTGVLIDLTLAGSTSGRPISWRAIDRISIGADGLATERVSYFDSAPLAATMLRRPRSWPAFVRSRLRVR